MNKHQSSMHKVKAPLIFALLTIIAVFASGCSSNDNEKKTSDFQRADGINGGRLYSKFWAEETGFELSNSNLAEASELESVTSKSDFFRCKHCHGWDRLGRDGGYVSRAPSATRPNVSGINLAWLSETSSEQELFDKIKKDDSSRRDVTADLTTYDPTDNSAVGDMMPNFSQILTDAQIWDIVKFLKTEALDTEDLYTLTLEGSYPDGSAIFTDVGKNGLATNGDAIFASKCSSCHGDDGTLILVDGGEYTVGRHVRAKPYEDQHKVKFGNLGSSMGAILKDAPISDIQDLLVALQDDVKYPDTAPVVLDGVALFNTNCASCHVGNGMGQGANGDVTNKTAIQITGKIGTVPAMAGLAELTDAQIEAIADALVEELDGAALFTTNCGSCHIGNGMGQGGFGDVSGKTAAQITAKIETVQLMASLSVLTEAQIAAIAGAL